jgi:hypothetical protein
MGWPVSTCNQVDAIAGGREAGASSGRLVTSLLQLMDRSSGASASGAEAASG